MSKQAAKEKGIRLFDKWSAEGVAVEDMGLRSSIAVAPIITPHSDGKHEHQRFRKSKVNIVERLTNNMMRPGKCGGKKTKAISIVKNALQIAQLKTNNNPIQILVKAIENSAPCEEVTRIVYGGVAYPVSVDVAPQRRIDLALRFIAEGARQAALGNPKTIDECLADEVVLASQRDPKSQAVKKRDEIERIALSSR